MRISLNRAAERRAELNRIGAVSPPICSGLAIAFVMAPKLASLCLGHRVFADAAMNAPLFWILVGLQFPLMWMFLETTAWRRVSVAARARKIVVLQALALGAVIGVWRLY